MNNIDKVNISTRVFQIIGELGVSSKNLQKLSSTDRKIIRLRESSLLQQLSSITQKDTITSAVKSSINILRSNKGWDEKQTRNDVHSAITGLKAHMILHPEKAAECNAAIKELKSFLNEITSLHTDFILTDPHALEILAKQNPDVIDEITDQFSGMDITPAPPPAEGKKIKFIEDLRKMIEKWFFSAQQPKDIEWKVLRYAHLTNESVTTIENRLNKLTHHQTMKALTVLRHSPNRKVRIVASQLIRFLKEIHSFKQEIANQTSQGNIHISKRNLDKFRRNYSEKLLPKLHDLYVGARVLDKTSDKTLDPQVHEQASLLSTMIKNMCEGLFTDINMDSELNRVIDTFTAAGKEQIESTGKSASQIETPPSEDQATESHKKMEEPKHSLLESIKNIDEQMKAAPASLKAPKLHIWMNSIKGFLSMCFRPFLQSNLIHRMYSIFINGKEVIDIAHGTPTQQDMAGNLIIDPLFQGFIGSYEASNKRHLYISHQNLIPHTSHTLTAGFTSGELDRARKLHKFAEEHPKALTVVTLSKDSDFYYQKGIHGQQEVEGKLFCSKFISELLDHNPKISGNKFPAEIKNDFQFRRSVFHIINKIHLDIFEGKENLTIEERKDFIEIAYAEISKLLIQSTNADSFSIVCKDKIDRGAASDALLYTLLAVENDQQNEPSVRQKIEQILLPRAMIVRKREIIPSRLERFQSAAKVLLERPENVQNVKKNLKAAEIKSDDINLTNPIFKTREFLGTNHPIKPDIEKYLMKFIQSSPDNEKLYSQFLDECIKAKNTNQQLVTENKVPDMGSQNALKVAEKRVAFEQKFYGFISEEINREQDPNKIKSLEKITSFADELMEATGFVNTQAFVDGLFLGPYELTHVADMQLFTTPRTFQRAIQHKSHALHSEGWSHRYNHHSSITQQFNWENIEKKSNYPFVSGDRVVRFNIGTDPAIEREVRVKLDLAPLIDQLNIPEEYQEKFMANLLLGIENLYPAYNENDSKADIKLSQKSEEILMKIIYATFSPDPKNIARLRENRINSEELTAAVDKFMKDYNIPKLTEDLATIVKQFRIDIDLGTSKTMIDIGKTPEK